MTTPDDRRTGRYPSHPNQSPEDRQARARRAPLFPLEAEDIAPSVRRGPPAPLGELLGDIDAQMPTKAAPMRPPPRQASPQRPQEQAPRGASPETAPRKPGARPPEPARPGSPGQGPASAQRPVSTRERAPTLYQDLRPAPGEGDAEAQMEPLLQARTRLEDTAADLAHLEHRLALGWRGGQGGYLRSLPPAPATSQWAWMGVIALLSLLILLTFGGAGGAGFSRWGGLLDQDQAESRAVVFAGQARPAGDYTLRAPPSISVAQIDRILASYGSPAAGTGEVWYNLGLEYGIDPAFAIAFFIQESTAGTAQAWAGLKADGGTTHNVGNIICAGYASCYGRFRDYPSWAEGIEDWYRLIDVEYLKGRGHQTVADIIPVYAPSFENDVQGYVNVVQGLVDEWRRQGAP